jgi:hypothetical protein
VAGPWAAAAARPAGAAAAPPEDTPLQPRACARAAHRTRVLLAAAGAAVRHAVEHLEGVGDAAAGGLLGQLPDKADAWRRARAGESGEAGAGNGREGFRPSAQGGGGGGGGARADRRARDVPGSGRGQVRGAGRPPESIWREAPAGMGRRRRRAARRSSARAPRPRRAAPHARAPRANRPTRLSVGRAAAGPGAARRGGPPAAADTCKGRDLAPPGHRDPASPHESISSSGLNRPWAGGMSLWAWGGPRGRRSRSRRGAPGNAVRRPARARPRPEGAARRALRPATPPGRATPGLSWGAGAAAPGARDRRPSCESPMVARLRESRAVTNRASAVRPRGP